MTNVSVTQKWVLGGIEKPSHFFSYASHSGAPLLLSFPQRTGSRAWWMSFATLDASSAALHLSLFSPKLVSLTLIVVGGGWMLKVEADLEKETHRVTVAKDSWKRSSITSSLATARRLRPWHSQRLRAGPSLSTSSGPASCSEVSTVRQWTDFFDEALHLQVWFRGIRKPLLHLWLHWPFEIFSHHHFTYPCRGPGSRIYLCSPSRVSAGLAFQRAQKNWTGVPSSPIN